MSALETAVAEYIALRRSLGFKFFGPEQRLTVAQAVEAYTLGAAFAGRREKTEGSLDVGKLADLIIISQDIFDINPHKIGATKVLTTIVGGRVVYQADSK